MSVVGYKDRSHSICFLFFIWLFDFLIVLVSFEFLGPFLSDRDRSHSTQGAIAVVRYIAHTGPFEHGCVSCMQPQTSDFSL